MASGTVERRLNGVEVALTGRLASMTRAEAERRITDAGGSIVATPGPRTRLLVVGQDGPPLGEDGRLTNSLREALALQHEGREIRIVDEEEWLALVGLEEKQENLRNLYTTAQLARILEVPAARIRAWVRHELLQPVKVVRRLCFFDFRLVACARRLAQLTRSGVTPQRLRRSLRQLATWYPGAESALSQLEALEQGGPLVVRTPGGELAETSGQLRLDFQPAGPADADAPLPPVSSFPDVDELEEGEAWFERGVFAEENGRLEEALEAYKRSLAAGGPLVELLFNLGNTLYALDRKADAAQYFERATEVDPEFVESWNNLGNALSETGDVSRGLDALRRALALEPDYADAHFNLAETLVLSGEIGEARKHWLIYLAQDSWSPWADVVRERLEATDALVRGV